MAAVGGVEIFQGDFREESMMNTLLASLAEGASAEEIRADFPTVTVEALRADS